MKMIYHKTIMPNATPDPTVGKPKSQVPVLVILLVFLAGLMLGGIVFAGVWFSMNKPQPKAEDKPPVNSVSEIMGTTTLPVPTTTTTMDQFASTTEGTYGMPSTAQSFDAKPDETKMTLDIEWTKPVNQGTAKVLAPVVEARRDVYGSEKYTALKTWLSTQNTWELQEPSEEAVGSWLLGTVKNGKYQGSSLYYRRNKECVINPMACTPYHFLVSADGKEARLLDSLYMEPVMGDPYDVSTPEERSIFIEAYGLKLPISSAGDLYSDDGQKLEYIRGDGFFSEGDSSALYTEWLANGKISLEKIGKTKDGRDVYGSRADGRAYVQDVDGWPLRLSSRMTLTGIVWDKTALNGKTPSKSYETPAGGCGESFWIVSPDDSDMSDAAVVAIGKTKEGQPVYMPKDPTKSESVRLAYEGWYVPDTDKKPDFSEFLRLKPVPVIFWKDAFGRWAKYLDADVKPMAECGKPVIYLYPEKTTAVSVRLPGFIEVTVSEPAYPASGWRTVARPDGRLTMSDGKEYGSLYWEGLGVVYLPPKTGFLVKDGDQAAFLSDVLPKYGLNLTEAKEFMDFWLPQMKGSPYYRVSFLTNEWDQAAPLYVNPRPETSIRIFMDWQKLSGPMDLKAPEIATPEREGFTLVEWGGLLYK